MPEAETKFIFLSPRSHDGKPLCSVDLGDSVPIDESDNIVQESTPFVRIGIVAFLLELLFPIWEFFLWYLKQKNAVIASATPITTPIDNPIIKPEDSPSISFFTNPPSLSTYIIRPCNCKKQKQWFIKNCKSYTLQIEISEPFNIEPFIPFYSCENWAIDAGRLHNLIRK